MVEESTANPEAYQEEYIVMKMHGYRDGKKYGVKVLLSRDLALEDANVLSYYGAIRAMNLVLNPERFPDVPLLTAEEVPNE